MQAWALQQVLKSMGHEAVTIDRQSSPSSHVYKLARFFYRSGMRALGKRKIPKSFEKYQSILLQNTSYFIGQNMTISEPLYSTQQLREHFLQENYNALIVGSDQVWRPKYSPNIYNFFADFIDNDIVKIGYAASFGVDRWEYKLWETRKCRRLARNFDGVSVREKTGVLLCENKLKVKADFVLDPTLLLSSEAYESLIPAVTGEAKGKVLSYILDESRYKKEIVLGVSSRLERPVFSLLPTINDIKGKEKNLEKCIYPRVEEWLMAFRDADYVVTDSFHGCVFSIIFRRPFIAVGNYSRGLSRFKSLLNLLGLKDRLIAGEGVEITSLVEREIDWPKVNSKILKYKNASLSYLRKWL